MKKEQALGLAAGPRREGRAGCRESACQPPHLPRSGLLLRAWRLSLLIIIIRHVSVVESRLVVLAYLVAQAAENAERRELVPVRQKSFDRGF